VSSIHGDDQSLVHPRRMSKIFIWGDFFLLNLQSTGAGLAANSDLAKAGEYIVVAGLVLHLVMFGIFFILATVFHLRVDRGLRAAQGSVTHPNEVSESRAVLPWRRGLLMLYACSVLIMIRSVFRITEYIMGADGVFPTTSSYIADMIS
jgi:hypothetical protein